MYSNLFHIYVLFLIAPRHAKCGENHYCSIQKSGIDSFALLTHPFGARFARPNRQAGLSNPVVYFEGSNTNVVL